MLVLGELGITAAELLGYGVLAVLGLALGFEILKRWVLPGLIVMVPILLFFGAIALLGEIKL